LRKMRSFFFCHQDAGGLSSCPFFNRITVTEFGFPAVWLASSLSPGKNYGNYFSLQNKIKMIETFLCILESLLPSVFAMGEKNNKKNVSLKLQLVERPRRAYGRLAYKTNKSQTKSANKSICRKRNKTINVIDRLVVTLLKLISNKRLSDFY
jgi:hypothetical protein